MRVDDFTERKEVVATMPTSALKAYLEEVKRRGADTANLELTLHSRTSTPFAILVLTFIGVAVAARRLRGGTGLHLFAAIVLGFAFVFASKVISVWAAAMALPPWSPLDEGGLRLLASWLPNLLFALLGVVVLARAQVVFFGVMKRLIVGCLSWWRPLLRAKRCPRGWMTLRPLCIRTAPIATTTVGRGRFRW